VTPPRRKAAAGRKTQSRRSAKESPQSPFTVFLDRDGVFNVNPRLAVFRPNGFRWLPGAKEAFARLDRPGIRTSLATNQPLLGAFGPWWIRAVNRGLQRHLAAAGGRLDNMEASLAPPWLVPLARILPGRLRHAVRRRKPGPGMLEDGAAALGGIDKARAVMVGDKKRDAQAAAAFGIPCILLHTTETEEALRRKLAADGVPVHAIVAGLPEAVGLILAMADGTRARRKQ
jgi:D-glycero-D-manno-heptose 1,7-bisphosphate phosphatase